MIHDRTTNYTSGVETSTHLPGSPGTWSATDFVIPLYIPKKITPISVKELKVGNYYRDIMTGKLIRLATKDEYIVQFRTVDSEGDVFMDNLIPDVADRRFYDDGTIAQ